MWRSRHALFGMAFGVLGVALNIKYPLDTPLANLHLTLLDKMGIAVERFGDSTGKIELLSRV